MHSICAKVHKLHEYDSLWSQQGFGAPSADASIHYDDGAIEVFPLVCFSFQIVGGGGDQRP